MGRPLSSHFGSLSSYRLTPALDDGVVAADAEGFGGDAQDGRTLASFVFGFVDAVDEVHDGFKRDVVLLRNV